MRLLVVSREFLPHTHGGTAHHMREVADRLPWPCDILTLANPSWSSERRHRILQVELPPGLGRTGAATAFLLNSLSHGRGTWDVIVGNALAGSLAGAALRWSLRRPLLAFLRDVDALWAIEVPRWKHILLWLALSFILASAARVLVPSRKVALDIHRCFGYPLERMDLTIDGVVVPEVLPPAVPLTGRPVLFVGAIKPNKGMEHLIEAIAEVRQRIPEVTLHIVGSVVDARYRAHLVSLATALGVEDILHFYGRVADPGPWYAAAEVVVQPSVHSEGFGIPCVEAGAYGKPLVATSIFGDTGVAEHGANALVVPTRSGIALANAIVALLEDGTLRQRLGAEGRERARLYTWAIAAERMSTSVQRAVREWKA